MVDFTSPMWKDSLRFVEPNLSGIGGLHLVPTAEHIVADVVVPALQQQDPELQLEVGQDIRELLMQEVLDHLEAIGRPARNICFVEPKYAGSGPDEQEALAQYFHDRYGLKVMHADPAELTLQDGEVYYDGDAVDLAYRDYAVADLIDLEQRGRRCRADAGAVPAEPHHLLDRGRAGPEKLLGSADRPAVHAEVFQRRRAAGVSPAHPLDAHPVGPADAAAGRPDGRPARRTFAREREALVLKPNRSYGGEGVVIGPSLSQAEWEAAIDQALADTERWVVQQLASIPVCDVPGGRAGRHGPRRAVLHGDGLRAEQVRPGDPGAGVAEAGGQRGPARRHVRGDGRPAAGAARRPGRGRRPPEPQSYGSHDEWGNKKAGTPHLPQPHLVRVAWFKIGDLE